MSVTVLVTPARFSLPGGKPWVELSRFLVSSFQFSFGISILLLNVAVFRCPILRAKRRRKQMSFIGRQILYDLLTARVRSRNIRVTEYPRTGEQSMRAMRARGFKG